MKNLFIILLSVFSVVGLSAQAQTKKPATKTTTPAKTTSTTKKVPAKTTTTKTATTKTSTPTKTATAPTKATTVKPQEKVDVKSAPVDTKQAKVNAGSSNYKTALGLKFIYGVALTGKFFIKENAALEGIVRLNGLGNNVAITGLYEHHADIKTIEGLRWYVGGGGHVNLAGGGATTFGVAGILGLEYKIKSLPLAISADWNPAYLISPISGFSAENGGLGVKYTF